VLPFESLLPVFFAFPITLSQTTALTRPLPPSLETPLCPSLHCSSLSNLELVFIVVDF
jgi:hypothetical protein